MWILKQRAKDCIVLVQYLTTGEMRKPELYNVGKQVPWCSASDKKQMDEPYMDEPYIEKLWKIKWSKCRFH